MDSAIVAEQLKIDCTLVHHEPLERAAVCEWYLRANRCRTLTRAERTQETKQVSEFGVGYPWRCRHAGGWQSLSDNGCQLLIGTGRYTRDDRRTEFAAATSAPVTSGAAACVRDPSGIVGLCRSCTCQER